MRRVGGAAALAALVAAVALVVARLCQNADGPSGEPGGGTADVQLAAVVPAAHSAPVPKPALPPADSPPRRRETPRQTADTERPPAPVPAPRANSAETRKAPAGGIASAPGRYSIADMTFSNHADAVLGNLLMMQEGDDIIGDPDEAYQGFAAAFDKALEQPITIGEEDDDFQRELKEAVIELREELAKRRADGEDIEEVLAESWRQFKELSLFRKDIESQVENQLDDVMTQEDYENLVGEANLILSEEGMKPLELPATLKRALRLRRMQEEAIAAEAAEEFATEE